jgi:ferrous iron transport protein B
MLMGFGCTTPAVMAARAMDNQRDRRLTMMITPFMSCGARLPVYLLLAGAFFPAHGGIVILCLYLFGIVVAVLTAKMLRRFKFKKDETPFVMELPPYRLPTAKATLRHMWDKAAQYLKKMGGVILIAAIIIWFLSYFPRTPKPDLVASVVTTEQNIAADTMNYVETGDAEAMAAALQQQNSYIGRVGQFVAPVMAPLGMDWRATVALISGAAAKEVIVSTLGVLYSENGADENSVQLKHKLHDPDPLTGQRGMTSASAIAFLVFVLLYFPCIASLAAIAKETGSWKWALFAVVYDTIVAWVAAFIVYRIALVFL